MQVYLDSPFNGKENHCKEIQFSFELMGVGLAVCSLASNVMAHKSCVSLTVKF